jgi:hypothetical protein
LGIACHLEFSLRWRASNTAMEPHQPRGIAAIPARPVCNAKARLGAAARDSHTFEFRCAARAIIKTVEDRTWLTG